jgi:hypothetical protein
MVWAVGNFFQTLHHRLFNPAYMVSQLFAISLGGGCLVQFLPPLFRTTRICHVPPLSPISFTSARRTARLLFRADKIVFALATFSVKERWPASIEPFQLVDERMVHIAY